MKMVHGISSVCLIRAADIAS